MTVFWLVAAGLVLLAYALFWRSLHRPPETYGRTQLDANLSVHHDRRLELEQERQEGKISDHEFEQLVAELERELLDLAPSGIRASRAGNFKGLTAVIATLAVLPLIALALYFGLGRPDLLTAPSPTPVSGSLPASLEAGVERLRQRLRETPDDPQGWRLLGRSYLALGQPDNARDAYERALHLAPGDLDLKARYAEVLAQLQGGDLRGEPARLLEEILKVDPGHPYALWLSGLAALHAGDRDRARRLWQTLLDRMPPDSAAANQLRGVMARAGLAGDARPAVSVRTQQVRVRVQLAPDLAARADPVDPVYIFARAAEGPRMPLAIVHRQVKDLPLTLTLDDTMAMLPQLRLSSFKRIVLGARVAKSGNAQGAPGDLEGWTNPIAVDDPETHDIVIDRIRR